MKSDQVYGATLRYPTEQFAYIEIACEGTPDEILEIHEEFRQKLLPKPTNSIPDKDFNQFLDNMLLGSTENHIEIWEKMSPKQQDVAQHLKRALKRIQAKNETL